MTGYCQVDEYNTLTLDPGVELYFGPGSGLYVNGTLSADGEDGNEILFTSYAELGDSAEAGDWNGIDLLSTSESVVNNCDLHYATQGIYVNSCSLYVDSSVISDCQTGIYGANGSYIELYSDSISNCSSYGIDLYSSTNTVPPELILTNSTVINNDVYGIYTHTYNANSTPLVTANYNNIYGNSSYDVYAIHCHDEYTELDFRFNWWGTSDGFAIEDLVYGHFESPTYYPFVDYSSPLDASYPGGVPQPSYLTSKFDTTLTAGTYYMTGYCQVDEYNTLTLDPGVELYFGPGSGLYVNGTLSADGEDGSEILFTSYAELGDSAESGDWNGIDLLAESMTDMNHFRVEYANTGIYAAGCEMSIYNGVIENNTTGLQLQDDLNAEIGGCSFRNCETGLYAYKNPYAEVTSSEFRSNSSYDIHLKNRYDEYFDGFFRNCNIYNDGGVGSWGIYCSTEAGAAGGEVDAAYCWWRYPDSATVEADFVYDNLDNSNLPRIVFTPIVSDSTLSPCPSDFNFSGRTDGSDLAILGVAFGTRPWEELWNNLCNISLIGSSEERIDGLDLALFGSQFGIEGGCLPFSKLSIPDVPLDSFYLVESHTYAENTLECYFEPRIPQGYNLIGISYDIITDTASFDYEMLDDVQNKCQQYDIQLFSSITEDRIVFAAISLKNESIEANILRDMLHFRMNSVPEDNEIQLENIAFILEDYELILDPDVVEKETGGGILPQEFALYQNYPNPFNPSTTISYSLDTKTDVVLTIYNVLGQIVRDFEITQQSPGKHQIQWDGNDSNGDMVASGVYFYRLKTAQHTKTRKMMLLK